MKKTLKTLVSAWSLLALFSFKTAEEHGNTLHTFPGAPEMVAELSAEPGPGPAISMQEQYVKLKETIIRSKRSFQDLFRRDQNRSLDETKDFLYHALNDSIFTYWYGTPWDFNGTTQEPRNGLIACGYFVTTTLRDAGIPLRRVHLAQQRAGDIIKQLCKPSSIATVRSGTALRNYLSQYEDGSLLIVGLDHHVGFISKEHGQYYFIHANYLGDRTVVKERLEDSEAIFQSSIFALGDVLGNERLLRRWLFERQ